MLIGYARVSRGDQNPQLQHHALAAVGCGECFTGTASGAKSERPGLRAALSACRAGDRLVVWKLDRLGRSLRHLVETIQSLDKRGVGFRSLQEQLDTTTSGGRLILQIFASLAEFEREVIRERTNAGLTAARGRGRKGGRPKGVDEKKRKAALALKRDPTTPSRRSATLSASRATPTTNTPASETMLCCVPYPRLFSALQVRS